MTLTSTAQKSFPFTFHKESYKVQLGPKPIRKRKRVKFEDLVFKANCIIALQDDFSFDDQR